MSLVQSINLKGMFPRMLRHVLDWTKAHNCYSIEFEERSLQLWVFVRTWDKKCFRRVRMADIERFTSCETSEFAILVQIISSADTTVPIVSLVGDSDLLGEIYSAYIAVCFLRRCMQKSSSVVFESLDTFSLTEILAKCLKGADNRVLRMSRTALSRAVITGDLSMTGVFDVVASSVGVWPLIVSYSKKTRKKDDVESLVI